MGAKFQIIIVNKIKKKKTNRKKRDITKSSCHYRLIWLSSTHPKHYQPVTPYLFCVTLPCFMQKNYEKKIKNKFVLLLLYNHHWDSFLYFVSFFGYMLLSVYAMNGTHILKK